MTAQGAGYSGEDDGVRAPVRLFLLSMSLPSLALSGCTAVQNAVEYKPTLRGNRVESDTLKELTPGTSTKADVTALLGSPTSKAMFDDNRWIYISELTQPLVVRKNAVLSQEVVVLTFDQSGVLRNVEHLDKDDSVPVAMASGATPSPGSEASFLQQLFGNVGKFSPGNLSGGSSPGNGVNIGH